MERLLTHPATAPLVHADHTHRAALPLASRPSAATGTFYEETSIGRVDSAPWTFEIGDKPLDNASPLTNYKAYKHCYTARNMINIQAAVTQYFNNFPEKQSMPIGADMFQSGAANLFLEPQSGGILSPYFVVKIGDKVETRQFTKEGLTDGIGKRGDLENVYIKKPVRLQAREVLEIAPDTLMAFQKVFNAR